MPPVASRGHRNIYKNSVSSVEAEMGMEEQIMFIEQCIFYMSSVAFLSPQMHQKRWRLGLRPDPTQAHWGSFRRSLDPLAVSKRAYVKASTFKGKGREKMGRKGKEGERGRQNYLCPLAPETLALPLTLPCKVQTCKITQIVQKLQ